MIAVDTNILIYAHRAEAPWHDVALELLVELANSGRPWAIPWPCVHEFLSVVTRTPFAPPSSIKQALGAIEAWQASDVLVFIGEGEDHFERLKQLVTTGRVTGGAIHDARIAAICLAHGVTELWSADRGFSRFPELSVVNPLAA